MRRWDHGNGGVCECLSVVLAATLLGCASTVEKIPEEAASAADVEEVDLAAKIEVLSREMPSNFWISDELASEKVVRQDVSVSDHISEGMREGAGGGAKLGLQIGVNFGIAFPPLLALTPVLTLGGAVIGAAGGTIVGAGIGGAKEAESIAMAKQSERGIAYASLNMLAVASAQKEIDTALAGPRPELNSGNFEPDVAAKVGEYVLWIRTSSVRIRRESTACGCEECEGTCTVRVDIDTELQQRSDRRAVWQSRYRAEHSYVGDERSAGEEALRQSGREIAALTMAGLRSGTFARERAQLAGNRHRHGGASIAGSETVPVTRFSGKPGSLQYFGGDPGNN